MFQASHAHNKCSEFVQIWVSVAIGWMRVASGLVCRAGQGCVKLEALEVKWSADDELDGRNKEIMNEDWKHEIQI